jgi:predicted nucleic acid-binding protein
MIVIRLKYGTIVSLLVGFLYFNLMKETIYLETTIISYYTSRPSNDIIVLAKQRITDLWWNNNLPKFEAYISETVIEEISEGDADAATKRLSLASDIPLLEITDDVHKVYKIYMQRLQIPEKALRDAIHIAIASVHSVDYLVTWNCKHIANGEIIKKLMGINIELGLSIPVIVTPEELMEV